MDMDRLVDNIKAICKEAPNKIPQKWANIRSISIKTSHSMALPIYNKTPEELAQISKMAGIEGAKEAEREKEEEEEAKKKKQADVKKRKAKSPLVQALKKSQTEEKRKGKKQKVTEKTKKETPAEPDAESVKSTKKQKKSKKETPTEPDAESVKSVKKQKKSPASDEGKEFIASKKFSKSKKGYVFRKGDKGVGYYVDVKPVVDRMAMEAFKRTGNNSQSRGRSKTPNSKRRGRR